jgi:acyl dehydratase
MMAEASMESVVLGMAVTATAFVVVATTSLFGGLLAPGMVTIGVASVVIGDRASYTSQPATRAASPAYRPRWRDAMTPPAMDAAFDVQAQCAESGDRRAARCRQHTRCV